MRTVILHLDSFRARASCVQDLGLDFFRRGSRGDGFGDCSSSFDAFEELAERHLEGCRQSGQVTQTDLPCAALEVGDMNLVDPRLFGKVDLPPTPFLAELPDFLAKLDANIRRHSSSIDLVEALYLVDALSRDARADAKDRVSRIGPVCRSRQQRQGRGRTPDQMKISMKSSTRKGIAAMRCGLLRKTG